MERLPMLGSPEWLEACVQADKGIMGERYESYEKPKRERLKIEIPEPTSCKAYPASMQKRGLELMLNEKVPPKETAAKLYKETGIYITPSGCKNWLHHYRKRERAKANAQNA